MVTVTRVPTILSCSGCAQHLTLSLRDTDDRPTHRCRDGEIKSFDKEEEK